MLPIQHFAPGVIAEIIRRQPESTARTAFAWQIAVGPAIARATTVEVVGGILKVTPRDARWGREVNRAADTILARMQHLLGARAVTAMTVLGDR